MRRDHRNPGAGARALRSRGGTAALLAALLVALATAASRAADTVISFDDPAVAVGSPVVHQYDGKGIAFDRGTRLDPIDANARMDVVSADPIARSAPNDLSLSHAGAEFGLVPFGMGGSFAVARHSRFSFWIRRHIEGDVTVHAYRRPLPGESSQALPDTPLPPPLCAPGAPVCPGPAMPMPDPKLLAKVTVHAPANVWTPITVDTGGNARIHTFAIDTPDDLGGSPAIDNFTFDTVTGPEGPDFVITVNSAGSLALTRGGPTVITSIHVYRLNGSAGPVTLTVNNLPPGVLVDSLTPNPSPGPGDATLLIGLKAAPGAPAALNWPVQITATGPASAGPGPYSVTLPVLVPDTYDAQIVGMEVTQGIQNYDLPARPSPLSTDPVSYNQTVNNEPPVTLVKNARTAVRVFADLRQAPTLPVPLNLACELSGTKDGQPLPGSPLSPDRIGGSAALQAGPDTVSDAMRAGNAGTSYFFTLPASWTQGTISLTARLIQPAPFKWSNGVTSPVIWSDTASADDSFTLTDIAYQPTQDVLLAPVALRVPPDEYDPVAKAFRHNPHLDLPDPADVFGPAQKLLPVQDGGFGLSVGPYVGEVWITDIWYGDYTPDPKNPNAPSADTTRADLVDARLASQIDDFVRPGQDRLVMGVYPGDDSTGVVRGLTSRGVAIVQSYDRPYTSVSHEMQHLLGRIHASGGCNASDPKLDAMGNIVKDGSGNTVYVNGNFESWPPDEKGYLQGVGVDTATGRVMFAPRDGSGTQYYDLMSYCSPNGGGDPQAWISIKGWNELLAGLKRGVPGGFGAPQAAPRGPRALQDIPTTVVTAVIFQDGTAAVADVHPSTHHVVDPDPQSPYHLVVRDAAGNILSDTGMQRSEMHADDAGEGEMLQGEAAVMGAQTVEVVLNGATIARRARSAHAPDLQVTGVQSDTIRAGQKITQVDWHATDADNDPLLTRIDYSADGGQTWQMLYYGPNSDQAALDSKYFSASANGMVRVRVNDGFNETTVASQPFVAAGHAPVVRITSPVRGKSFRAGASVYLSGQAYDDTGQLLDGDKLVWFANGVQVGTGPSISTSNLAAGANKVQLQATDSRGQTASQSLQITVAK